jgi:hypothetical protein
MADGGITALASADARVTEDKTGNAMRTAAVRGRVMWSKENIWQMWR